MREGKGDSGVCVGRGHAVMAIVMEVRRGGGDLLVSAARFSCLGGVWISVVRDLPNARPREDHHVTGHFRKRKQTEASHLPHHARQRVLVVVGR